MAISESAGQVLLQAEHSALKVLYKVLADTASSFDQAFSGISFPEDLKSFRQTYPQALPWFELARINSPQRSDIAAHALTQLNQYLVWQQGGQQQLLSEALTGTAAPLPLRSHTFGGAARWQPNVVYRGESWEGARLAELGALLAERGLISAQAGQSLAWVITNGLADGQLELSRRKIAVLGGGAEMAPTRLWLECGADVLWLDRVPPPAAWYEVSGLSGRLFWPEHNADLLRQPREVLATLLEFADGDPLDLGLYAYAPGQTRELLLTAVMNALVNQLPRDLVGSVTMLVSPTTPTQLDATEVAMMQHRPQVRAWWESACARMGLLGKGIGCVQQQNNAVSRTVVAIQGASYQAAQYLGKVFTAEHWHQFGQMGTTPSSPLRVSANTAAITRTRSLSHPVFAAAFGGAAAFGVETMTPRQSRRINGLLSVRDWLDPQLPVPGQVRVHGGIHSLAYPLESALRVAAAIGFARSPRLLKGLLGAR